MQNRFYKVHIASIVQKFLSTLNTGNQFHQKIEWYCLLNDLKYLNTDNPDSF